MEAAGHEHHHVACECYFHDIWPSKDQFKVHFLVDCCCFCTCVDMMLLSRSISYQDMLAQSFFVYVHVCVTLHSKPNHKCNSRCIRDVCSDHPRQTIIQDVNQVTIKNRRDLISAWWKKQPTYAKWGEWLHSQRWRTSERTATLWRCKKSDSCVSRHSFPPKDSGGQTALQREQRVQCHLQEMSVHFY